MFRLSLILVLIALSNFAYSSDKKPSLNPNLFKVIGVARSEFIVLTEKFERVVIGESGVLKGVPIGGVSEQSSYFLTDVDDLRYDSRYKKIEKQIGSKLIDEALLAELSPSLDFDFAYKVSRFYMPNSSIYGFIVAGKNKKNHDQNVYELYFENSGDLFSLTYFTNLSFEKVFT